MIVKMIKIGRYGKENSKATGCLTVSNLIMKLPKVMSLKSVARH